MIFVVTLGRRITPPRKAVGSLLSSGIPRRALLGELSFFHLVLFRQVPNRTNSSEGCLMTILVQGNIYLCLTYTNPIYNLLKTKLTGCLVPIETGQETLDRPSY